MDSSKRHILEHFEELLRRLRRSVVWLVIGFIAGYAISGPAIQALTSPLLKRLPADGHLIYTAPFEKFWVYMRVAFVAGCVFALPAIAIEIGRFIGPGLKRIERRRIGWLIASFTIVFIIGVAVGYQYILPAIINAILRFGSAQELPFLAISAYVNAAMGILLVSAVFFEIPVIMVYLTLWGWVPARTWSQGRRLAIVGNAVLSAILSPPDPMSMLAMMLPIQLLYEGGIIGARVAEWWAHAKLRNETPASAGNPSV